MRDGSIFFTGWANETLQYHKKMAHILTHQAFHGAMAMYSDLHCRLDHWLDVAQRNGGEDEEFKGSFPIEVMKKHGGGSSLLKQTMQIGAFSYNHKDFTTHLDRDLGMDEFICGSPVHFRAVVVAAVGSSSYDLNMKLASRIGLMFCPYVSDTNWGEIQVYCNGIRAEEMTKDLDTFSHRGLGKFQRSNMELMGLNCEVIAKDVTLVDDMNNKGPIVVMKELEEKFVDESWLFQSSVEMMVRFIV